MTKKKKKTKKTCDCFLDLCIGIDVFICETGDNVHLGFKILTTVACCLSCVNSFVQLLDAGMKEKVFIQCNREQLRSNYSNSYNNFYFYSDSKDSHLSCFDEEIEELVKNQFQQSFCFTELRLSF